MVTVAIYHTHTHGRTPLDEGLDRRRDLYLTTHNNEKRQTSMPSAGFEPEIPASKLLKTYTGMCPKYHTAKTYIGDVVKLHPFLS
jgi:hypothetical protein